LELGGSDLVDGGLISLLGYWDQVFGLRWTGSRLGRAGGVRPGGWWSSDRPREDLQVNRPWMWEESLDMDQDSDPELRTKATPFW